MTEFIVNPGQRIQDFIDGAEPGDIITVNPGTYEEPDITGPTLIRIDKPLTVRSSGGPEVTFLNGNSEEERNIVVEISAANVVLEGFTITNPLYSGSAEAVGVRTRLIDQAVAPSDVEIRGNIIREIGTPARQAIEGTYGIRTSAIERLRAADNEIYEIRHASASAPAIGISIEGTSQQQLAIDVTLEDNRVYNIQAPSEESTAVAVKRETANVFVRRNRIEAPEGGAANVKRGIATSPEVRGRVEIAENAVKGATDAGMRLGSPAEQVVTRNEILENRIGIFVEAIAVTPPVIQLNTFSGNEEWGLFNASAVTVNAENNYWGPAGPNTPGGDDIGGPGPVEFIPFLRVPPGVPFVTTGPIANLPSADRPISQLYVVIENVSDTEETVRIECYFLTDTQNLYVLELNPLAPESSPGSTITRTYYANFDLFELRFFPSSDRVLISVWGLDPDGQLAGKLSLVNNELTRFS